MGITLLDIILLTVTLISALLAMVRGFSREVLSIAAWGAAAAATLLFYKAGVPYVQPYVSSTTIATIASAAGIFIITLIVVSLITMKIADLIIDSRIGPLDRALGFLFGAARGMLIFVVATLFFNWLVDENQPGWIANAKSKPLLDSLGERLVAAMPENPQDDILKRLKPEGDAPASAEGAQPSN